ncbi:hypothetical protein ABW19_dt0204984 [Dactylella cylindrospora]|nr:hypothetical protein ABW19_dt0204984 [Dactylella cylindrospora]
MSAWSFMPLSPGPASTAAAGITRGAANNASALLGSTGSLMLLRSRLAGLPISRPHNVLTRPISNSVLTAERIIATDHPDYRRSYHHHHYHDYTSSPTSTAAKSRRIHSSLPFGSASSSSSCPSLRLPRFMLRARVCLVATRYQFTTTSQTLSGPPPQPHDLKPSRPSETFEESEDQEDYTPTSHIPPGFKLSESKKTHSATSTSSTSPSKPSTPSPEPRLKTIYSSAAAKAARAPAPPPAPGSWQHYRNKIFDLSGGNVTHINIRTYLRWQLISATKIFLWMLVFSALVGTAAYAAVNMYCELKEPTPDVFPEMIRITMHWIYFHAEIQEDLPLAGLRGRSLMMELEEDMNKRGGWDNCPIGWRRAYIDTCFRVAKLFVKLGKEDDAYIIYRRILAVDPDVVGDRRLSEAYLKMGECALQLNKTDEGLQSFQSAVKYAVLAIPKDERPDINHEKPVLPEPGKGVPTFSPEMLSAVQAIGIHFSRLGKPSDSLPIFLSLLRTIQSLPDNRRDSCQEASVMAYLGEVIWALGKKEEGLAWTKKALYEAEKGAGERNTCRDCANYAVANAITMTKEFGTKGKGMKSKEDVQMEVNALRSRENQLGRIGYQKRD